VVVEYFYHTSSLNFSVIYHKRNIDKITIPPNFTNVNTLIKSLSEDQNFRDQFFGKKLVDVIGKYKLNFDGTNLNKLKDVFSQTYEDYNSTEVHDQIKHSARLPDSFWIFDDSSNRSVDDYSLLEFLALNVVLNSIKAYRISSLRQIKKIFFPIMKCRVSQNHEYDGKSANENLSLLMFPVLTIRADSSISSKGHYDRDYASLSFFSIVGKNDWPKEALIDFVDSYEGGVFKTGNIQIELTESYPLNEFKDIKKVDLSKFANVILAFCEKKLDIFEYKKEENSIDNDDTKLHTSEYKKEENSTDNDDTKLHTSEYKKEENSIDNDDTIWVHTSLSGRVLNRSNELVSIPDFRNFPTVLEESQKELIQYAGRLSKIMKYNLPEGEEGLKETASSLSKIITRREDNSTSFFSKKSNRLVSLASFKEDFPSRSYLRFAILNMFRAETIGMQRLILMSLNYSLADNASFKKYIKNIKYALIEIRTLFNLDMKDDFTIDELPALQELSGINSLYDKLLNHSNLILSLKFYEDDEKIMKYQLLSSVLISILTALLLYITFNRII